MFTYWVIGEDKSVRIKRLHSVNNQSCDQHTDKFEDKRDKSIRLKRLHNINKQQSFDQHPEKFLLPLQRDNMVSSGINRKAARDALWQKQRSLEIPKYVPTDENFTHLFKHAGSRLSLRNRSRKWSRKKFSLIGDNRFQDCNQQLNASSKSINIRDYSLLPSIVVDSVGMDVLSENEIQESEGLLESNIIEHNQNV